MKDYFENVDIRDPLDPREAFFGGRTNATFLKKTCGEGERIDYLDICSLYPYVNKYKAYPIGHPDIITENFKDITATSRPYNGIVKCRVLPPKVHCVEIEMFQNIFFCNVLNDLNKCTRNFCCIKLIISMNH